MGKLYPRKYLTLEFCTHRKISTYVTLFWQLALQLLINPTGLASPAQPARWIGMCTQQRGGSKRRRPSYVAQHTCR